MGPGSERKGGTGPVGLCQPMQWESKQEGHQTEQRHNLACVLKGVLVAVGSGEAGGEAGTVTKPRQWPGAGGGLWEAVVRLKQWWCRKGGG